jgi:uncharacterized membrane protein YsdA (DUF1294 family)
MLIVQLLEHQTLIKSFNYYHANSETVGATNPNRKKASTIMLRVQLLEHQMLIKKASTIMLTMQLLKHKTLKKSFNFHSTSATVGAQNPKKAWTIMLTVQSLEH